MRNRTAPGARTWDTPETHRRRNSGGMLRSGARLLQSPKGTSGSERHRDASCIAQAFRLPRLPNRWLGGMVRQLLARQPKLYGRFSIVCQKCLSIEGKHVRFRDGWVATAAQPRRGENVCFECNRVAIRYGDRGGFLAGRGFQRWGIRAGAFFELPASRALEINRLMIVGVRTRTGRCARREKFPFI